jgi:hypothetical protein
MAHIFSSRKRIHNLTASDKDLRAQFRWETINAIAYKIGGLLFVIGSFFLFPSRSEYAPIGGIIFLIASLIYLSVNIHDMLEIRRYWTLAETHPLELKLEYFSGFTYLFGTLCFIFGRVVSFPAIEMQVLGTWLFIVGSLLFVIGAVVNVLLIIKEQSMQLLQLMNLTAITFILGSVLYGLASVPYLWFFESSSDHLMLLNFSAWQYMLGSILFLLGGVFNYWRAYLFLQNAIKERNTL